MTKKALPKAISEYEGRAGTGVHANTETYCYRLPDGATIFSAELKALLLALEHVTQNVNFIIFSHSLPSGTGEL